MLLHKDYTMPPIHEIATVTSKGQVTLPKAIRQALGLDTGSQIAFEVRGSEVVVSRTGETAHEDPAIASFLALIEKDLAAGRNTTSLPDDLARAMIEAAHQSSPTDEEIEGDVAL